MSKLLDKVIANSTVKETTTFDETKFFTDKEQIRTDIPILNMACSGEFDGGFRSGLTVIAGPSKHFKSNLGLAYVRSYLNQHKDAVCLYYDSEFGSLPTYLHGMGIDTSRVVHTPVLHIEQLKFDLTKQITSLDREDKVIIFIDSLGNLASKKEADDALDGKSAADMTRAKQIKSLFRIATPHFTTKDIPCVCINHTYQCGTGDMLVATPDGNKMLKEFKVGDDVLTSNGVDQVQFTTKHEGAMVFDIELDDGSVLSFTEGHRFRVNGEWKYVHDLQEGDVLDTHEFINKS